MPNKISQLARSESGHNLAVAVTFQFLLVVRPVIELSGRYSAIKLMTSLPQPGQNQPVGMLLPFRTLNQICPTCRH
jgi:hypothetical protein